MFEDERVGYELRMRDAQLDNQSPTALYPVTIARHFFNHDDRDSVNILHVSALQNMAYKSITFFHYLEVRLWNLDIKLDIGTIDRIMDFFHVDFSATDDDLLLDDDTTYRELAASATIAETRKLYFGEFCIHPLHADVAFKLSYGAQGSPDSSGALKTFFSSVGGTLANIEAPLRLRSLGLKDVFATNEQLTNAITSHYQGQAIAEMYKIIFSFECIGNPASLLGKLSTGVEDLVYEPYQGIVRSPADFVLGIHKGTTSLAKNTVAGVFGAGSKLTGTIGAGLGAVSMDREFLTDREIAQSRQPQHLFQGVTLGAHEFGSSVKSGVKGIVQAPIRGARESAWSGFVRGAGIGVVGAIVKPTVGMVDFATRALQGVQSTYVVHTSLLCWGSLANCGVQCNVL